MLFLLGMEDKICFKAPFIYWAFTKIKSLTSFGNICVMGNQTPPRALAYSTYRVKKQNSGCEKFIFSGLCMLVPKQCPKRADQA